MDLPVLGAFDHMCSYDDSWEVTQLEIVVSKGPVVEAVRFLLAEIGLLV